MSLKQNNSDGFLNSLAHHNISMYVEYFSTLIRFFGDFKFAYKIAKF